MALPNKKSFAQSAGAIGLVATLTLGSVFGANAQDNTAQLATVAPEGAPATEQSIGKTVTLRVGPGFDRIAALGIKEDLDAQNCPTIVTNEKGIPGLITVQVDGEKGFSTPSVGSAGRFAEVECLTPNKP